MIPAPPRARTRRDMAECHLDSTREDAPRYGPSEAPVSKPTKQHSRRLATDTWGCPDDGLLPWSWLWDGARPRNARVMSKPSPKRALGKLAIMFIPQRRGP